MKEDPVNELSQSREGLTLTRPDGASLAYHSIVPPGDREGVTIVFLGGFMSDMEGSKALFLEDFSRRRDLGFVRFDYFGHGRSSGSFADGTIGRWKEDALAVIDELTTGPLLLVGSSMGGWIMLLAALKRKERLRAIVGIAAAPDFTRDLMWNLFPDEVKKTILDTGRFEQPTDYGDDPYIITKNLIEDGNRHLLLDNAIELECPVRLYQGMKDADVPWNTSIRITDALTSKNVEVTLVKDGDHRMSEPEQLEGLATIIDGLL
jgi:pimeloyl-ACP methyl ester carboxylesterase